VSLLKTTLAVALLAVAFSSIADTALDARLKKLEEELRCLVCQNQSLADSSAGLAEDLRREVRALAVSGKNDEEIKQFLVARYGDFVLYNPPVKSTTWLLWFGPFVLLAGGGFIWWLVTRRRSRGNDDDDDDFRPPGGGSTPGGGPTPEAGVEKARALLDSPLD
jgi:cytochrome c-type biogenesis protein CcmH